MDGSEGRGLCDARTGAAPVDAELTPEFACAVDLPAGRMDRVLSAVTGQPLCYFTPDPLEDLLCRGRLQTALHKDGASDPLLALMLVRAASTKSDAQIDLAQARRFAKILHVPKKFSEASELIALASEINPTISGLRGEIVFAGGRSSSAARHIYAPPGRLAALMESLSSALKSEEFDGIDPLLRSAIVGMFCTFFHPFLDGNGRWARLVSASTWRMPVTTAWPAMVGAVFQNTCKTPLTLEMWSRAMTSGIREYLGAALEFESTLNRSLRQEGVFEATERLNSVLERALKNRRHFANAITQLYCTTRMPIQGLRGLMGASLRAANGTVERAIEETQGAAEVHDDCLDIGRILAKVNFAIRNASMAAFK